jgi:N-acetylglucosaminyl-diphospho-decaprenol L-rhamnosyltransferase
MSSPTDPSSGPTLASSHAPQVDVVIVNFNAEAFLSACLASVERAVAYAVRAGYGTARVVVVDNDSRDQSRSLVASGQAEWISTGSNLGFGCAANRGFAATNAPFVFLLNPDVEVSEDAIVVLFDRIAAEHIGERDRLGVVGPAMRNLDGTVYPSARPFPSLIDALGHAFVGLVTIKNPWSRRYLDPNRMEWVSGSAMLVRRAAFDEVGGFDEDFFMYVEDVDLCWRLRRSGWMAAYEPRTFVTHHIGGSSEGRPSRMIVAHHRSLFRYETRTATGVRRLFLPLVAVGLCVRAIGVMALRAVKRRAPASFHR